MIQVKLELDHLYGFIPKEDVLSYERQIYNAYRKIYNKTGAGNDFLGWVELPLQTSDAFLTQIEAHAAKLRAQS